MDQVDSSSLIRSGRPHGRGLDRRRTRDGEPLHECRQEPGGRRSDRLDANTGEIVWISNGLQHRVDQGLVDPDTGEGLWASSGSTSTAIAMTDVSTFIVGPNFAIPEQAQLNGAECHRHHQHPGILRELRRRLNLLITHASRWDYDDCEASAPVTKPEGSDLAEAS